MWKEHLERHRVWKVNKCEVLKYGTCSRGPLYETIIPFVLLLAKLKIITIIFFASLLIESYYNILNTSLRHESKRKHHYSVYARFHGHFLTEKKFLTFNSDIFFLLHSDCRNYSVRGIFLMVFGAQTNLLLKLSFSVHPIWMRRKRLMKLHSKSYLINYFINASE